MLAADDEMIEIADFAALHLSPSGPEPHVVRRNDLVASLIGRSGSSAIQTIHRCGVDVTRGLVLLFGIGTKALGSGFFSQEVFMQSSTSFSLWRRLGGRDDDQRGARFRARFNRATTLYSVGPRT